MYGISMTGTDLLCFKVDVKNAIDQMDQGTCNLMDYFHGSHSIKDKVERVEVTVTDKDGVLYGCAQLTLNKFLEQNELMELCDYITGQYSDGWGEGFEQVDIPVGGGYLNVHFYHDKGLNFQEIKHVHVTKEQVSKEKYKPKMKLLGEDGNIFAILGRASRLLKQSGQSEAVDEMYQRVTESGDYYKALAIISEYVETELSTQEGVRKSQKVGKKKEER